MDELSRIYIVRAAIAQHSPVYCSDNAVVCQDPDCSFEGSIGDHGMHVAALVIKLVEATSGRNE